jgi:hypothetical protein
VSKINEQAECVAVEYWEKVEATGLAYEFTPKTLVIAAFRDGLLAELKSHRNEVRQLERENAALRADKERLDWLQSATVRVDDILTYFMNSQLDLDLRAVIDAARKEQP